MRQNRVLAPLAFVLAASLWAGCVEAQSLPTASQALQITAFGGASGVYTGLGGGKNLSITTGVDLGLAPHRGIRPVIEVRGTYPIDKGTIASQKSVLGGLRADFLLGHRIRPYGDFLFGRGQMDYQKGGYLFNFYEYDLTTTYVYSPGGGLILDMSDHFALRVDAQYQRWSSAPTASGTIYSPVGTVGLVYLFDFNRHPRH